MGAAVTAAVITLNEAANILPCLRCLTWAEERLVVDAHSTDGTAALARGAGARVLLRPFDTYARQRNYGLQEARRPWVLFVDADERVEPALAREIQAVVRQEAAAQGAPVGYWVPRRNLMLGQWVRHGGWWPDYQLRLLRRGLAHYDETQDPHEVVRVGGPTGCLNTPLLHYNYTSLGQLFSQQRAYAQREARTLLSRGVAARPHRFLTQPTREFYRRYIQLHGYRDGPLGLLLALVMAWYQLQVYANLRRMAQIDGR